MKIRKTESQNKTQTKKQTFSSFYIILILTVIIIIFLFFIWQHNKTKLLTDVPDYTNRIVSEDIADSEPPPPIKTSSENTTSVYSSTDHDLTEKNHIQTNTSANSLQSIDNGSKNDLLGDINTASQQDSPSNSTTLEADVFSKKCLESTEVIKNFYAHLDMQEYMKSYSLAQSSDDHFTQLIQRLLDNPPVVSGETDDLFTILQNTAHFFRVIGKDNILILKGILDREKNQFENVLYNFYSIFQTPSCPVNSFNLTVSESSLYDYAGFFLNTMGGRLYLFRRDSMSRMVVSYYSILLIDQANKEARNLHGIEIKTAIDQLIAELEESSKQLKFEQLYLDNLYNLKELYQ